MLNLKIRLPIVPVLALGAVAALAWAENNPFGRIDIKVNRTRYAGACPAEIVFRGYIQLNQPRQQLAFNYHWTRSDGATGQVMLMHPDLNQTEVVVPETWTLGAAGQHYEVSETLWVNSGNTHLNVTSRTIPIDCR